MVEAVRRLAHARNGEGRRAAARRIDGNRDVSHVALRLAHVVEDGRADALDHGLDVRHAEGLFRAVGRNAERFAEPVARVARLGGEPCGACVVDGGAHSMAGSSAQTTHERNQWCSGYVRNSACACTCEQRADRLDLLGTQPTGHGSQLVSALLRVVSFEALICVSAPSGESVVWVLCVKWCNAPHTSVI